MKNKIRNIIELCIYHIHKYRNKNINYRKLVTSPYNVYPKPVNQWFIAGKTTVKKWAPIKTRRRTFCGGVWSGGIFHGEVLNGGLFGHRYVNVDGLLVLGGWII